MTFRKTVFDAKFSDNYPLNECVSSEEAASIFRFFNTCALFRWQDANNDCEDRANAICILLDNWGIANYKVWVFGGAFIHKGTGRLVNCWNYHVAAALPVQAEGGVSFYAIDPATSENLNTIEDWAAEVTAQEYSYHIIKRGCYYIFPPNGNLADCWYKRNSQNFKWTIQGLSGINGVSRTGKAQLVFQKQKIKKTENAFRQLMRNRPSFLQ